MEASPLHRLPPELRDRIYEYVILPSGENRQISISVRTGTPQSQGLDLRFIRTCRQLRQEITPVLYGFSTFTIITKFLEVDFPYRPEARRPFSSIQKWLEMVGVDNVRHLSHVCIDLGWYTVEGSHDRITQFFQLAQYEIHKLIHHSLLPVNSLVLRAAYFIEVFPPIGHIMRYIDIPVADREAAEEKTGRTTRMSKEKMPGYAVNRDVVFATMDLFRDGVLGICCGDNRAEEGLGAS